MSSRLGVSHTGLGLSDEGERYFRTSTWADAFQMYFPHACCHDPDGPGAVLVSSVFALHGSIMEMSDHLRWRQLEVVDLEDEVLQLKARACQLEDELGHSPSLLRADVSGVVLGDAAETGDAAESSSQELL